MLVIGIDRGCVINACAMLGLSFVIHIGLRDAVGMSQTRASIVSAAIACAIWIVFAITAPTEGDTDE